MSTVDAYLQGVLSKYQVMSGPGSLVQRTYSTVYPILSSWAGTYLKAISFSGSCAKGTAVAGGTDVDIFISLSSNTPETLQQIFDKLFDLAQSQYWLPRRQNVSIGVSVAGAKVDLVPGKVQPNFQNYHSLYKNKTGSWTQTNVQLHINTVANSGRLDEIRLTKIWRNLHALDFPSFYLELAVINALSGCRYGEINTNFQKVLEYLRDKIQYSRFVDPSNTNNIISDDLSPQEKLSIANAASKAAAATNWGQVVW